MSDSRVYLINLVLNVISYVCMVGVLLCIPAGTVNWQRAWVLLGVLFVARLVSTLSIAREKKGLLAEREKSRYQKGQPLADKVVLALFQISFLGLIVFIGMDIGHMNMFVKPNRILSTLGLVLVVAGWTIMTLALKTNPFAAPVVKVDEERKQTVIDTGVYGIVRHPYYVGVIIFLLGMPLWLESVAGILFALIPSVLLGVRVVFEERFLRRRLSGYRAYVGRVRSRLIPLIW